MSMHVGTYRVTPVVKPYQAAERRHSWVPPLKRFLCWEGPKALTRAHSWAQILTECLGTLHHGACFTVSGWYLM